jgi:hypothetical protein
MQKMQENGQVLQLASRCTDTSELIATLTDKEQFTIAVAERSQGTPRDNIVLSANAFLAQHQCPKVNISTILKRIDQMLKFFVAVSTNQQTLHCSPTGVKSIIEPFG